MRKFLALLVAVAILASFPKVFYARLIGTNPTGSSADVMCNGGRIRGNTVISATEICQDSNGNWLPTSVSNTSTLGTSAFPWTNAYSTTITAGSGGVLNSGLSQLATQTTAQLVLRSDPIGSIYLAAENNQTTGAAVTNAYNECVSTAAAVASYVYIAVSTNSAGSTPAVAGAACSK